MSVTDELLRNNEAYAASFDKGHLGMPPTKKVAVVACMDARLQPNRILGLEEGEAHVIRNAGGVITDDEIRSLAISQQLLGTEEIILMHHTDCGMLTGQARAFPGGHAARLTGAAPLRSIPSCAHDPHAEHLGRPCHRRRLVAAPATSRNSILDRTPVVVRRLRPHRMDRSSQPVAAACAPMQERQGRRSRAARRLDLVHGRTVR